MAEECCFLIISCWLCSYNIYVVVCSSTTYFVVAGMLSLKDLADTIAAKLQDCLFVGDELNGRKDDGVYACKILKVLEDGDTIRYEVAWLDRNKKVVETSVLNGEDLIKKKQPFSRNILKSFIRESTYRSSPWVLHDNLARKHGISTDLPVDLRGQVSFQDGLIICNKKRRKNEDDKTINGVIILLQFS